MAGHSRHDTSLKRLDAERRMFPDLSISPMTLQPNGRLQWCLRIPGPLQSPYTDHVYELEIEYESTYPFSAPITRVRTPIFHPNITLNGQMSNLLVEGWNPATTVNTLYQRFVQLLATPIKAFCYNDVAAELYFGDDTSAFCRKVQETYEATATAAPATTTTS